MCSVRWPHFTVSHAGSNGDLDLLKRRRLWQIFDEGKVLQWIDNDEALGSWSCCLSGRHWAHKIGKVFNLIEAVEKTWQEPCVNQIIYKCPIDEWKANVTHDQSRNDDHLWSSRQMRQQLCQPAWALSLWLPFSRRDVSGTQCIAAVAALDVHRHLCIMLNALKSFCLLPSIWCSYYVWNQKM